MITPRAALVYTRCSDALVVARPCHVKRVDLGRRFDQVFALIGLSIVIGLFLDGWAHSHVPKLDTFFTPWHAVLYSGFFATAAYLVWTTAPVRGSPIGYDLSLLGTGLFLFGGVCDMAWHIVFGIEQSVEALFSPTHLLIATGGILLLSGPLRASWHRAREAGGAIPWPALLSLSYVLATLAFFAQYSHPFFEPSIVGGGRPALGSLAVQSEMHGVLGVLVYSALVTGAVLFALRRWRLPIGSLTVLLTASGVPQSVINDQQALMPVALLAGLAADGLAYALRPSSARPARLRLFAFALPATYYAIYFVTVQLTTGVWWSIHMSTGSVALAGVVGLLLSLLAVPPSASPDLDIVR